MFGDYPRRCLRAGGRARESVLGIKPELIVHLPLLGIAQDVVSLLNVLESVFRRFVAGIEIGMILAREFAVGLADIVRRGLPFHAERLVIFVLWRGHKVRPQSGFAAG